ncbi:MAG: hypothetical protein IKW04_00145 [Clostridia bacterium]|nr:hypothetical protein [Clostridia bacterium]
MERNFTVNEIITILLKRLWLIVTMALIGGIIAFAYSQYVLPKKYTAKVALYVYNEKTDPMNQGMNVSDFNLSAKLVNTYMVILKSDTVLDIVSNKISRLGVNYDAAELRGMISSNILDETEVFEVAVTCTNPEHAKLIADAIEQVAPEEIIRVVRAGAVETVDRASLPTKPSSPNVSQNTIIGVLVGLVLACGMAFVFELMNTSVKSKEELSEQYKLPVLSVIPNLHHEGSSHGRYGGRYGSGYYHYSYGYGSQYQSEPENPEQGGN